MNCVETYAKALPFEQCLKVTSGSEEFVIISDA